jgi:hypothetical protein
MKRILKTKRNLVASLLLSAILAVAGFAGLQPQSTYAHNFTPDESASFLSLVDRLQGELQLVRTNLEFNNTLPAQQHARNAAELLDEHTVEEIAERNQRIADGLSEGLASLQNTTRMQHANSTAATFADINQTINNIEPLLGEAVTARIDSEQMMDNSTIHALAFSLVLNQIDKNYSIAFGLEPAGMAALGGNESAGTENASTIASISDYQTARALVDKAQEAYETRLKPNAPANATEDIATLGTHIARLDNATETMAPPIEITRIVHTQLQICVMEAFDLELGNSRTAISQESNMTANDSESSHENHW